MSFFGCFGTQVLSHRQSHLSYANISLPALQYLLYGQDARRKPSPLVGVFNPTSGRTCSAVLLMQGLRSKRPTGKGVYARQLATCFFAPYPSPKRLAALHASS